MEQCGVFAGEDGAELFAALSEEDPAECGEGAGVVSERLRAGSDGDHLAGDFGRGPEASRREDGESLDGAHGLDEDAEFAAIA